MMPYPRLPRRRLLPIRMQTALMAAALALPLFGCPDGLRVQNPDEHPPLRNAEYFLQAANTATGQRAALMRLSAGELLIVEQQHQRASEVLEALKHQPFSEDDRQRLHLARGEALLHIDRAAEAVDALNQVPRPESLGRDRYRQYLQLKIAALTADKRPVEAAATHLVLGPLLDRSERPANDFSVWQLLKPLNADTLLQYRSALDNNGLMAGWLDLALVYQQFSRHPDGLPQALSQWQGRYPSHPAAGNPPVDLTKAANADRIELTQVAVLLPLSGRLATTGRMVRDGIVAAHFDRSGDENSSSPIRLRFYDSAGADIATLHQQAVVDGASAVIGPIEKPQLQSLLALGQLPVPTLALNVSDDASQRADGLYQFGLPVEDDAEQVATRALASYRHALIVSNDDAVGLRAAQTMNAAFTAGGGTVIDTVRLGPDAQIQANVATMLGVEGSRARMTALKQIIGKELGFEVRRRQDVEVILLAVKPSSARRVKPFLNLYFAQDLPVLATSQLFSGQLQPADDRDLNGIEFCDAPWLLEGAAVPTESRQRIAALWPAATGNQGRLFALGYDAYGLLPELERLLAFPDYRLSGLSGDLRMDDAARVHRGLGWGRFRDGRPVAVPLAGISQP